MMGEPYTDFSSTLNRLNQFDEDTQREILQSAAKKLYFNTYGEDVQEALDRKEWLKQDKEENGTVFQLMGVSYVLNENDRLFFTYYLKCTAEIKKAVDNFKDCFKKTVTSVTENNVGRKSTDLNALLRGIGRCVIDELWDAVIEQGIYTQDKDALAGKMEQEWLGRIAGIKGFVLGGMYYDFKYDNKPSDMSYMLRWLQELRNGMWEVEKICTSILEKSLEFAVDAAKHVHKDGVLLNAYEYSEYVTVKGNILATRVMDRKRRIAFIENMEKFPVYMPDYVTLIQLYGDANHEVESIMEYLGQPKFYKELRISLVNDRVSDISRIKDFSPYDEETLQKYQTTVEQALEYYGLKKDTKIGCLTLIKNQLVAIDQKLRTVRGRTYETREEAAIVRSDFSLLDKLINDIGFAEYDLLDEDEILKVKNLLLAAPYESDTLKENPDIICDELEPVLTYQIQLQTWRKQLQESQEPWVTAEEIINGSDVATVVKDKFKYWNFDGLKKYYPRLLGDERPILFMKASILGWNQYFVLTNKRGLHITKNNQEDFSIDDGIKFVYNKGFLRIGNDRTPEAVKISMTCSDDEARHLTDILVLIADTLNKREETIFELPENYYPEPGSQASTGAVFTNQVKGIFKNKVSPFFKGNQNVGKSADTPQSDSGTSGVRFCTQCGAKVKGGDRFCAGCGNKLQ